ncbi:MAG TPA: hypothetical protein VFS58_08555 [Steroidobacteraceae bacterium]|nr:hypothetical protein [Steroidobacteraceae bacterium]
MRTVEAKLADWHRLYKELAQAQSRLEQGGALPHDGAGRRDLESEVARLQRDCDVALDAVHTLLYKRTSGAAMEQRQQA